MGLYVDIRTTFQTNADKQERRVDKVETRLDAVQDALRRSDSSGAVTIPGNVSITGSLTVTGTFNSTENLALIVALS